MGYDAADRSRRVHEQPKAAEAPNGRGEFQRDRARVLHSSAFRRLADKTQVVDPGKDDFPRTRLTHSLEVAQIAREMGAALGCDPDVVDAAGLAHDLGHPPFGHNGEDALNEVAADCGGFEGNAQTLRIVTRLEAKTIAPDGRPAGLNLTRAVLDATCKYPWSRRDDTRKFGVYDSDRPAFEWMRAGAPGERRCLEAQVMDWADDVAYSVHDLEDGVYSGLIRLDRVDDATRAQLCEIAAQLYSPLPVERLAGVLDELLAGATVARLVGYDHSYAAQAAAKQATSELTGHFVRSAVRATIAATGADPGDPGLSRYAADLVVPEPVAAQCALLKALAVHWVMRRPGAARLLADQRRLLHELVEVVAAGAPVTLTPALRDQWQQAESDAQRLRTVIDQVAALTDTSARAWHARLTGPVAPVLD